MDPDQAPDLDTHCLPEYIIRSDEKADSLFENGWKSINKI